MDKDELKKFILSRFSRCNYSDLYEACWRYYDYDNDEDCGDNFYNTVKEDTGAAWIENGCSKIALGFDELYNSETDTGYVVKIPIRGERTFYHDEEGIICETDEFLYSNASSEHVTLKEGEDWNYCEAESIIYSKAVDWNLDKIFAATYYICSIGDIPIYVSEFVYDPHVPEICSSDVPVDVLVNSKNYSKYSNYTIGVDSFFVIIPQYGEDFCCDLIDFISYFKVGDLHDHNMGVMKDGTFKIFDYSDYREQRIIMSIETMAAEDMAYLYAEDLTAITHKFFIIAKTLEGARFVSEDFTCFEDADEAFQKYAAVVKYFSDYGLVTMYEYSMNDLDIVKEKSFLNIF